MIALSCGIKISAVRHLVLSQSTRVTDRQTDRITTPKTALAYARPVKMAMVDVDDSSPPTGGLTAQVDWLGLRVGGHLALSLHSTYEPGELWQWHFTL